PRMPAASAISRRVNPRERRRLTVAVNIKINFLHLRDPIAGPFRPQTDHVDPLQFHVSVALQTRGLACLNQLYVTVAGIDRGRLVSIRKPRCRLDLGHPVGDNLANSIFLGTEPAGVDTILGRPAEGKDTGDENRQTEQHFIKRERASPPFTSPHSLKPRHAPSARNISPSIRRSSPGK